MICGLNLWIPAFSDRRFTMASVFSSAGSVVSCWSASWGTGTSSYAWLVIAGLMSIWAAFADLYGGIWGASRHALTVGFAATMVFSIGPHILPHFGGVHSIFSKRLMFLSLLFLQTGCLLREYSEPLACEGLLPFAWRVLPISGMLKLSGVLLFAVNLSLTFLLGWSAFAGDSPSKQALAHPNSQ